MLSIKATSGGAEYDLPVLTPAVRDRLQDWYDNGGFTDLVNPEGGLVGTDDDEPRCRVGSVLWPVVGATRFARAVLPIDSYTLGLLRGDLGSLAAEADGTPLLDEAGLPLYADARAAVTLSFRDDPTDPAEVARTLDMYLIASRPVSRTTPDPFPTTEPAQDDLWLITLVDIRYYWVHSDGSGLPQWWDASAPDYTWDNIFTALFARVGSAHTIDAPDTAYGDPTERWGCKSAQAASTAFLLDYAAQCVGSRIVMVPGAAPAVQRPLAAYRTAVTTWHAAQDADDRFAGGGLLDSDELLGGIPGAVHGTFQDGASVTVFLTTGMTGHSIEAWHDVAAWRLDKTAAITKWATDWYTWQDAPLDAVYAGFVIPPASGFIDGVEWYHDSVAGYTRVQRPRSGWVNPPDWRPDSFAAALTTTYGPNGYEWVRYTQKKLMVGSTGLAGRYAVEVNGRTDLQPGLAVEMFAECFGCGVSFEYNPPAAGCNLTYDHLTNKYKVDVPSLAGTGLEAVLVGDCYQLQVDAAFLPGSVTVFGCGLVFNGINTLSVDLSAVVNDPFVWTGCQLDLNIGCHLTLDGATGALMVDVASLTDDPAVTSLRVITSDTCDLIGVDLVTARTTTETLVNDVLLYRVAGGKLRLSKTRTTYTNKFNAATLHIDRTASGTETTTYDVDICDPTCCADCAISFAIDVDPIADTFGTPVDLTITTLSGCASPYTLTLDWGDGTIETHSGVSASDSFSHTYSSTGMYTVTADAYDECGYAADRAMVTVTVTSGSTPTCAFAGAHSLTVTASSTIPCLDGWSKALTTSMSGTWFEDNSGAPCPSDNGFVTVCTGDVWTGTWNNCTLTFVGSTATTVVFRLDDPCPPAATGVTTFTVTMT